MASNSQTKDPIPHIELSYLTKQLCIIAKVSRDHFIELDDKAIEQLMARVKRKLDAEKKFGRIERYIVAPETLIRAWPHLKEILKNAKSNDQFAIKFAFGIKTFDHVVIHSAESEDSYCEIIIDAPSEEIRTWNMTALSTYVKDYVHRKGWSDGSPDSDNLKDICEYAMAHPGEPTQLLKGRDNEFEFIKIHSQSQNAGNSDIAKSEVSESPDYPGKGLLKVSIDADGMAARISHFNVRWYEKLDVKLDDQWLTKELKRLELQGIGTEFIHRIQQKMVRFQDLNGLQVAAGIPPVPGKGPFIASVTSSEIASTSTQAPKIVSCPKGCVVAEIKFSTPATPGTDVYGKPVPAPVVEKLDIQLGDGVERVGATQFRATQDGLLKIDGMHISILKTYVIEGDVTTTSGKIDFQGNILVKGNIDAGAEIKASGEITVEGSIRGGSVSCKGHLRVTGGISTTETVAIKCGGDITANFIERATLYSQGNIHVENGIVQSLIFCGGDITVTGSEGRTGASTIYSWGSLNTTKLGFATGAATNIHLGEDWREARKTLTWSSRLLKITDRLQKDQNEERTLSRLKKTQLTKKKIELKQQLKERIARLQKISDRLGFKLEELSRIRKLNTSAKLKTTFAVDGDVNITIAGETQQAGATAA